MMKLFHNLWTARVFVIFGFLAGYAVVGGTFQHIGAEWAVSHSWYHFFREGFGDLGAMAAILVILFAAPQHRSPAMWWVMLILMVGFYAPFWVGMPFMSELAAPNTISEIRHLSMAIPALIGCFLARRHFVPSQRPVVQPAST